MQPRFLFSFRIPINETHGPEREPVIDWLIRAIDMTGVSRPIMKSRANGFDFVDVSFDKREAVIFKALAPSSYCFAEIKVP